MWTRREQTRRNRLWKRRKIVTLRAREPVPSLNNRQNRSPVWPSCPMHEKSSSFPWGTIARQKNQVLRQNHHAPWKTRWHFLCMGHAVSFPICDLTASPIFTNQSVHPHSLDVFLWSNKLCPCAPCILCIYMSYIQIFHTENAAEMSVSLPSLDVAASGSCLLAFANAD